MSAKARHIKGRDLKRGDRLQLEDGSFCKVTDLVRAPIKVRHGDVIETPRWAYLADGTHATVCHDDDLYIRA